LEIAWKGLSPPAGVPFSILEGRRFGLHPGRAAFIILKSINIKGGRGLLSFDAGAFFTPATATILKDR